MKLPVGCLYAYLVLKEKQAAAFFFFRMAINIFAESQNSVDTFLANSAFKEVHFQVFPKWKHSSVQNLVKYI